MPIYDFDAEVNRRGTHCLKYDCLDDFFGSHDLTPMWIADMDFATVPCVAEALGQRLEHEVYGYTAAPDEYYDSIRGWLRRHHGLEVEREELAFVPGVVRGLAFAINYFTRPGDKVVIQPPVYHPFRIVPEGNCRLVVENPLIREDAPDGVTYRMDLEGLEQIFASERPAMMILCNPHNPAGLQWDAPTLAAVARLAKAYGVKVISDEIHADLMLDGTTHVPFFASCPEAAEVGIMFGAPSKTFNMAGLESSWMVVKNPALREGFYKWMEVNEFSRPSFSAWIGAMAAYTHGDEWLCQLLRYLEGNMDAVERFCAESLPGIKAMRPQASFLMWLDCRGLGLSDEELHRLFLDRAHLALNEGTMFGTGGECFMRMNAGMPRARLLSALERLSDALRVCLNLNRP